MIIVLLVVLCLALGAGLIFRHLAAERRNHDDLATIQYLSNQWNATSAQLTAQQETNTALANALQSTAAQLTSAAAQLTEARTSLAQGQNQLREAKVELESVRSEVRQRETRIAELEKRNLALDEQADELKATIAQLESRIAATQQKLARSEGDREFLLKELKRLQTEKAEVERKFRDLVVLRAQVKKLKEELATARQLDWLRRGIYGQPKKGAELLQHGFGRPGAAEIPGPDLNVEIRRDGSSAVLPPTNPPPAPGPNR
jgi:chromosome segregation ATPase